MQLPDDLADMPVPETVLQLLVLLARRRLRVLEKVQRTHAEKRCQRLEVLEGGVVALAGTQPPQIARRDNQSGLALECPGDLLVGIAAAVLPPNRLKELIDSGGQGPWTRRAVSHGVDSYVRCASVRGDVAQGRCSPRRAPRTHPKGTPQRHPGYHAAALLLVVE